MHVKTVAKQTGRIVCNLFDRATVIATGVALALIDLLGAPAMAEPDFVLPATGVDIGEATTAVGDAVTDPMGDILGWGMAIFVVLLLIVLIRRQFKRAAAT